MREDIELVVRKILRENTKLQITDEISIDDDLSVLGLNSMTVIKLLTALECELEFELDPEDLAFENFQTIRMITTTVERRIHPVQG